MYLYHVITDKNTVILSLHMKSVHSKTTAFPKLCKDYKLHLETVVLCK